VNPAPVRPSRALGPFSVACLLVSAAAARGDGEPAAASAPAVLEPFDAFHLEYASDPRIAPDGSRVVYVRNSMDVMTDRRRSSLWIVAFDGTDPRPLTTGDARDHSPRWSPDGGRLAFVSDRDGSSQVWVRWMDTGQEARLTDVRRSPSGIAWSPDGERLAFSMFVPEAPTALAELPAKPEGAEWAPAARLVDRFRYRADGAGFLDAGGAQLFVLPAEGGTPRQVTHGPYDHRDAPVWTADGAALVFSANREADRDLDPRDSELYRLDLASGELEPLTDRQGPDREPAVSPDGRRLAYVGYDDELQGYQVTQLWLLELASGERRALTAELDRDVRGPAWSPDGARIWFRYDDRGVTHLASVSLEGELERHASDVGGTSIGRPYPSGSFTLARATSGEGGGPTRFAYTRTDPARPADVAVGTRGSAPAVVTDLNADLLDPKRLGRVEELACSSSHDGRAVQAWVVHPPGFEADRRYPLVLEIHGGPFANYGERFSLECQLYAAAGYVVLYVNPRGSTSYGGEFGNLIHHAYPGHDYDDLMSAVDALIERGYVDEEQLFVTGGSGGGVLTAWIVGRTDRFRAAVVAKPVINWTSFALTADAYNVFAKYWFPGMPWEVPEEYWRRSPLSRVGEAAPDRRGRPPHADLGERAVLPGAQAARRGDGHGAHPRRVPRHRRAAEPPDREGPERAGVVRALPRGGRARPVSRRTGRDRGRLRLPLAVPPPRARALPCGTDRASPRSPSCSRSPWRVCRRRSSPPSASHSPAAATRARGAGARATR